ncbi:MAG: hypothetical protein ACFFBP_08335 [Promethearchaeota archaeon]
MPSISHLILGGFFGICLYYISDKKFSKTHVFIFFLNNYLGPDVGWVIGLGRISHSILFWPLFALILACFYYYFNKFTLKIDGIRNIELIELNKHKLKYINTYLLVLAGGVMHNYLDSIINNGGIFSFFPKISSYNGISWTIEDFMRLWETGFLNVNPVIALSIGVILILGFVFIFVWFLKFLSKKSLFIIILYITLFMVSFFLLGSVSTAEHSDAGGVLYISLFLLTPLVLCALSLKDFRSILEFKKRIFKSGEQKLVLLIILFALAGILGLILSILCIIFNNFVVIFFINNWGSQLPEYLGETEIYFLALNAELLVLIFSIGNLACTLGLIMKNKIIWKLTIYYQLLFVWTIIGLMIACALSENSIKRIINPNSIHN